MGGKNIIHIYTMIMELLEICDNEHKNMLLKYSTCKSHSLGGEASNYKH